MLKKQTKLLSLFMALVMLISFMVAGQIPASANQIDEDIVLGQHKSISASLINQENINVVAKESKENIIRAAHTLVWYSNSSSVGYWRTSPMVYLYRVDGNVNFYNAMVQAIGIWESALGIDIRYSYLNSDNEVGTNSGIYFLGGTYEGLTDTEEFEYYDFYDSNGNLVAGFTRRVSVGNDGTSYVTSGGRSVSGTYFITTSGFIMDDGTNTLNNYYLNTCIHELGHALGWYGHSTNSADIMYDTNSNDISLSNRDILQIKQMYDIWY